MKVQHLQLTACIVLFLIVLSSACNFENPPIPSTPLPPTAVPTLNAPPITVTDEFMPLAVCVANTAEEYFENRSSGGFGSEVAEILLVAQGEKELRCGNDTAGFPAKLTITSCPGRFELLLDYGFFRSEETFDLNGRLLYGLTGSDTNSFCANTAFGAQFGTKPADYDQCKTLKPYVCDQDFDELLALFSENRFDELFSSLQVEEVIDWRDVGTLDAQTRACVAPTVEEFYQERQMEFGGLGGIFSRGSLSHVLENLPYGECKDSGQEFPINEVIQCANAIAFTNSGGFTVSDEYFSTDTGELVYATTSTDFNAFCHNASFDVSYGEKPPQSCQTTKVSYCNVNQQETIGLFESGDIDQIIPAILAAQDK